MKRKINLKEFLTYGTVGTVQKNMNYNLVQSQLSKPDVYDGSWYGDYELYYGDVLVEFIDNRLDCISIPFAPQMDTGNLTLDFGQFANYDQLTLLYVQGILSMERLDYTVTYEDDEMVILTILQSGVSLTFWQDEDSPMDEVFNFQLAYISVD